MQETNTAIFRCKTAHASRYLQQLFKHFVHKGAVEYDTGNGCANLLPGPFMMMAGEDGLVVQITARDAEGLSATKHIIDSHLHHFAFREGFCEMV